MDIPHSRINRHYQAGSAHRHDCERGRSLEFHVVAALAGDCVIATAAAFAFAYKFEREESQ